MGMGFSIQNFFIPILKRYKDTKNHQKVLKIAYIVGGFAYLFIALVGSYGIYYLKKVFYIEILLDIVMAKEQFRAILVQEHGKLTLSKLYI
jgi:hypothetical protein